MHQQTSLSILKSIMPAQILLAICKMFSHARLGDPISLRVLEELNIRLLLARTKFLKEAAEILGVKADAAYDAHHIRLLECIL